MAEEKKEKYVVNHGTVRTATGMLSRGDPLDLTPAEAKALNAVGDVVVSAKVYEALKAKEKAEAELQALIKGTDGATDEETKLIEEAKAKAEADARALIKKKRDEAAKAKTADGKGKA